MTFISVPQKLGWGRRSSVWANWRRCGSSRGRIPCPPAGHKDCPLPCPCHPLAWEPVRGAPRAPCKPGPSAQREKEWPCWLLCCVTLTQKAQLSCVSWDLGGLSHRCPRDTAGGRCRRRQDRTVLLALATEVWPVLFFLEPGLKSNIHFPVRCYFCPLPKYERLGTLPSAHPVWRRKSNPLCPSGSLGPEPPARGGAETPTPIRSLESQPCTDSSMAKSFTPSRERTEV